ncbi:unnamed protein product [Nezara viridula]|uniref:Uncharacterized protein n=1 Tax=Nezara viridula TaxID=85310 RepID=A0A9P0H206_NEZVI|nr:unnamed protein product [Nezara viridula]
MPTKYYVHGFKVFSILCSLFASVAAFCASGFALIHLVRLYKSTCQPANELHAICVCKAAAYALTYPDLNCPEVGVECSVCLTNWLKCSKWYRWLLICMVCDSSLDIKNTTKLHKSCN